MASASFVGNYAQPVVISPGRGTRVRVARVRSGGWGCTVWAVGSLRETWVVDGVVVRIVIFALTISQFEKSK